MSNVVATVSQIANQKIGYDIAFPNLNIFIKTLKNSLVIGNYTIAYYGIIIAVAMLVGFYVATKVASKLKINDDILYDIFIILIVLGIIGARIYYIMFKWDYYSIRPHEILDIRAGGLAVFGGIILVIIGIAVYCFVKKINFIKILDVTAVGAVIGQAIGRYGNFFNMEAFGDYTNNIFAMRMRAEYISRDVMSVGHIANIINQDGVQYIQAHPTFFYESTLNIVLFVVLLYIVLKKHMFDGQLIATYFIGYGIIRFFVESLRTDSLMLGDYKISQIVAVVIFVTGIAIYVMNYKKIKPFDKVYKIPTSMKKK